MGDLPRRVPGRAAGQFGLFQQHDVRSPALMGEVIGEPDPHDSAADDDDAGVAGKNFGHGLILFRVSKLLDRLKAQMYHRQS
jgi:hypothetical protein